MYRLIADALITAGVAAFIVAATVDTRREFRKWEVQHRG